MQSRLVPGTAAYAQATASGSNLPPIATGSGPSASSSSAQSKPGRLSTQSPDIGNPKELHRSTSAPTSNHGTTNNGDSLTPHLGPGPADVSARESPVLSLGSLANRGRDARAFIASSRDNLPLPSRSALLHSTTHPAMANLRKYHRDNYLSVIYRILCPGRISR
jgi:hypothetical protein